MCKFSLLAVGEEFFHEGILWEKTGWNEAKVVFDPLKPCLAGSTETFLADELVGPTGD